MLGFSLKAAGETIVLINANLVEVDELAIPQLNRDVSYARRSDGTFGYCEAPTPGGANTTDISNVQPESESGEAPEPMTGIEISEIVTSNGESYVHESYGSPDWIELHNVSDRAIDLAGWGVTDNISSERKTCILPSVTLDPDGYLLLLATKPDATDPETWDGTSPIVLGFSLKSTGETVALYDANGQTADLVTVPQLNRDVSYAKRSDGTFGYCAVPTPGGANGTEIADTMPESSVNAHEPVAGVEISEVSSRNTLITCGGCPKCDWVELHNVTDADIPLDGFTLCDELRNYDDANLYGVIPANGYLLVYCCDEDCATKEQHLCVKLGVSRYGETLFLFDPYGNQLETLTVPEMPNKDVTYARRADGSFGYCESPTPGAENVAEISDTPPDVQKNTEEIIANGDGEIDPTLNARRPSTLRISEALAKNEYSITDREGERCDWVELYNAGATPVSLSGWYLSDNPNNLTKWPLPDNASLPNGGYVVIFLSGKTSTATEWHAGFSLGTGETLFLYNKQTGELDWVTIPELADNVSVGLDENNEQVYFRFPTPGEPNGHGDKSAEAIGFFQPDGVYISEVCAVHDRGSNEADWIELYNGTNRAIPLDGWYLSDSLSDLKKYPITSVTIGAYRYTVLETTSSDANRKSGQGTFGISPSGETLYLTDANGVVRDVFQTGVQRNGMTSGRIEGDPQTARVFFTKKTKGEANSDARFPGYAAKPVFSETALYRSEPFSLTISCPGASIYYTTDGSEPTQKSSLYEGPIEISKSTVVRAIAYRDGLLESEIATYHYLFVEPHTLPVVCIAMSPSDFNTVYKVTQHSKIQERKGYVNYYESDGLMGTAFPCDVKAKGRGTLSLAQKSLTLSLRGAYGMSSVDYPFFPDYEFTEFSAFALRQAGQDYDNMRLADAFASRAFLGLNADCANSRFCIVYVNGKYYGIYDFNEELNSKYLETHFGVDSDMVNTVMRNGATAIKGSNKEFKKVFNAAADANLHSDSAYEKFIQKVDPDAFIDYVICRQYIDDIDSFNQKYWRTTDYSIRWRPILYDLDFCLRGSVTGNMSHRYFNIEGTPSHNGTLTYFYFTVALRTNKGWRERFVERYVELIMTRFSAENMTKLLDQMVSELEPEMARHIERWSHPKSVAVWKENIEKFRVKLQKRPEIVLEQVRKEFGLSTAAMNELIEKYK